jgi:hypothetical protein
MAHHILCPNQLRENSIRVNDIPLIYTPLEERNQFTHSIVVNDLIIPLSTDGVHSSFLSRVPSDFELANPHMFPQFSMTADIVWEPPDQSFQDNEYSIRSSLTTERYPPFENRQISESSMQLSSVSTALDYENLYRSLSNSAIITSEYLN